MAFVANAEEGNPKGLVPLGRDNVSINMSSYTIANNYSEGERECLLYVMGNLRSITLSCQMAI